MTKPKKHFSWSEQYWNHIKRNIGIIRIEEQELIRTTRIAIFGVGGLGGPIAEQLVRSGCEKIIICDNGKFIESNLNRQICVREDIGKLKINVVENLFKKINPEVQVNKYTILTKENISKVLQDVSIAVLTLDDPLLSILIARSCQKYTIPMIEAWAIPYLWSWWFTSKSVDYETCYGLKTHNISIRDLKKSPNLLKDIKNSFITKLTQFPDIEKIFDRENGTFEGLIKGEINSVSLAPIARMTSSYLTFDIIFSGILKIKKKILAPRINGYNYLAMKPFNFNLT